ncbi:uncharacterized protein [Haliotis cracherodii]|uniref:uncharacterized protein n=1 Tax=Haliotis cracherodii TaxID=6455 RepID=UPI0039E7FE06
MAGVFHVEFGFNDTDLTRALEQGNYASAERLILDNVNPSFLDEGCYQRIPLFICLCGMDEGEQRTMARNLYLAKLLIERGANVNYRVPVTYFGCEYMGPGKTALDLIIDYYNDLALQKQQWNMWEEEDDHSLPAVDVVVGLQKHYLTTVDDILDHLQDLIFIILRNGGDPNLLDENQLTPLHRAVIMTCDVQLIRLLCDNGSNVNAVDLHGNTPLLAMCDTSLSQMYMSADEDILPPTEEDDVPSTCNISNTPNRTECLTYLLSREDVQVNAQNNHGQTALFHFFASGDMTSSLSLLSEGADPSIRGTVWEAHRKKRLVSPLFTSFLWSGVTGAVPREVAHVVDKGYFCKPEIAGELQEYLEEDFPQFSHLYPYSARLIPLMFGGVTSTLSQAAARVIFQQCLLANTRCIQRILPVAAIQNSFDSEELQNLDLYGDYVTMVLNRTVVRSLVQLLGLPTNSLLNFEVELLLHQMAVHFARFKLRRPNLALSDEDYTDSDDSIDTEEGDSDLEYW